MFILLISFSGSLASIGNVSNFVKCIFLSNHLRATSPDLTDLNPTEYNRELHCLQLVLNLDRFNTICNTFNDISAKICVPNKTENLNVNFFYVITNTNESKSLTKIIKHM